MAIKVKRTETTETNETVNALAPVNNVLAQFSAENLFDIEPPKETSNLLPQVKIPYPIEMKPGKPFTMNDIYVAGLFDGSKFQPLKAPYIMTVIAGREATRKLRVTVTADGKQEKEYERAYKSMGAGFDKSSAVYEQHMTDPSVERGVSLIVGIIDAAGQVVVAELPAFKVLKDYWKNPLHQARINNGLGLLVKIDNHSGNVTASKKDPEKSYLDPKKFVQHQVVELTREQAQCIASVFEAAKDKFEAWAKQ